MIKINLLPFRAARKKENIRQQVSIFVMVFILVIICFGGVHLSMWKEINQMKVTIDRTDTELAAYKKKVDEVKQLEKELSILQKKMDVMAKLDLNRREPVRLLDEMTKLIVPDQMWLTNLIASENKVVISGIATDNQTVADFMTNLEESALFGDVNLVNVVKYMQNNLTLKKFNVNCAKTSLGETSKTKAKR